MSRLSSCLLIALTTVLSIAASQNQLPLCRDICASRSGQCNVGLRDLANTACFDDRNNQQRTCDCGITTLQQLSALNEKDELRDCVIPTRLFNFQSSINVKANLINVHAISIFNIGGALRQSGDVIRSTICEWKCAGRNRFQNCVISGNVKRSHFNTLSAEQDATLSIGGTRFDRSTVKFIRSDADIQIGCKQGFNANKVETLAMPEFGRFSTVAGTVIKNNRFDQMVLGKVSSFATIDGNSAKIASASGPCSVLGVESVIEVEDFLSIPDGQCEDLFRKV